MNCSAAAKRPSMDKTAKIRPDRPEHAPPANGEATTPGYLVHIYPTGPTMGLRYPLGEQPRLLGRGAHCDISLPAPSVSRRHASIQQGPDGYSVVDLESTNGTWVNDVPITTHALCDGDDLRIGNCIFRFLAGGNVEAAYHAEIYRLTIMDGLTE